MLVALTPYWVLVPAAPTNAESAPACRHQNGGLEPVGCTSRWGHPYVPDTLPASFRLLPSPLRRNPPVSANSVVASVRCAAPLPTHPSSFPLRSPGRTQWIDVPPIAAPFSENARTDIDPSCLPRYMSTIFAFALFDTTSEATAYWRQSLPLVKLKKYKDSARSVKVQR